MSPGETLELAHAVLEHGNSASAEVLAVEVIRLNAQIAELDMTMEGYESLELKAEVTGLSAALGLAGELLSTSVSARSDLGVRCQQAEAEARTALTRGWRLGKEAAAKVAQASWIRDAIRALPDDPPQEESR